MKRKIQDCLAYRLFLLLPLFSFGGCVEIKAPVDYVNPYMGNISHLLVPTYPTVHLPNSMLRIYPALCLARAAVWRILPTGS